MKALTAIILLFYIGLQEKQAYSQHVARSGIRFARITYLTSNLDSLTRSFLKKGYRIKTGKREPGGIFNNAITLPDGSEIILETTSSRDSNDWRLQALKKYRNHIAGIAFEVDEIDSLYHLMKIHNISISEITTMPRFRTDGTYYSDRAFALDSCAPLDVVFFSKDSSHLSSTEFDSLAHHPNHVFRFDWVLLSASPAIEAKVRTIFEMINAWKQHEGCCDFWRVGPSNDFCFFRFDPPPPKAKADWLSVEADGIYFAY
jgi:hypothetical protein